MRHQKHGFQVSIQQLVPVFLRDLVERLGARDPGIVDQNLDRTQAFLDGFHRPRDFRRLRDVGPDREGEASEAFDSLTGFLGGVVLPVVVHRHVNACLGKRQGDGLADATAGACHERHFPRDVMR